MIMVIGNILASNNIKGHSTMQVSSYFVNNSSIIRRNLKSTCDLVELDLMEANYNTVTYGGIF